MAALWPHRAAPGSSIADVSTAHGIAPTSVPDREKLRDRPARKDLRMRPGHAHRSRLRGHVTSPLVTRPGSRINRNVKTEALCSLLLLCPRLLLGSLFFSSSYPPRLSLL
eukprot:2324603-Rhodomonas_salina.1